MKRFVHIYFARPDVKACDHIDDICEAVRHASHNLAMRYRINMHDPILTEDREVLLELDVPDDHPDFRYGNHLRGIAAYLLKHSRNKDFYKPLLSGKRLLHYVLIRDCSSDVRKSERETLEEILKRLDSIEKALHCIV